jgi:hypothetical protein
MNNKLKKLYETYWGSLLEKAKDKKVANPLLIKIRKEYEKADIKIMICGQESYGWNGTIGDKHTDINFLMNDYEAYFYNNQKYFDTNKLYDGDNYSRCCRLKRKNVRAFWNRKNFKYFQKQLNIDNKNVAFVWNNLSKIGNSIEYKKGKGKATDEIQKLEKEHFPVFQEELKILQPNIIIFRTSNRNIPFSDSENITKENPVQIVKLNNFPNIFAIKTYHPRSAKKEIKEVVTEKIKNYILNHEQA